jgi:2-polyprenyl-3-methyl-5-hydroxy-6-metoxy-1,4-benzoquinol methylase
MDHRSRFYERMAEGQDWDAWTNTFETKRRIDIIFGRLLAREAIVGRQLLDAGAGGGHFSACASALGAIVTSIDVGENLLAQVASRCNSTCVVGSVLDLPFDNGTFDVVLSTEVIEHTVDPLRGLREIARVTKTGGRVVITTPCRLWQPVVRMASALKLRPYQGYENFIWPKAAKRSLEEAGFRIDQFFGFNAFPLFYAPFESVLKALDVLGPYVPSLFVNFAVSGVKET